MTAHDTADPTIRVPAEHAPELRRELTRLHQERCESLRQALERYLDTGDGLEELEGLLVEIRDLSEPIDELRAARGAALLHVHPEVVNEALDDLLARALDGLTQAAARLGAAGALLVATCGDVSK